VAERATNRQGRRGRTPGKGRWRGPGGPRGGKLLRCSWSTAPGWPIHSISPSLARRLDPGAATLVGVGLQQFVAPADAELLRRCLTDHRCRPGFEATLPAVTLHCRDGTPLYVGGRLEFTRERATPPDLVVRALMMVLPALPHRLPARGPPGAEAFGPGHGALSLDPVSGLADRIAFAERLDLLHGAHSRHAALRYALHMVGLDSFSEINNAFGFAVGDAVLREVAGRLMAAAPGLELIARPGGDRFALLQVLETDIGEAARLTERILACFEAPFTPLDQELHIGASIGLAVYPDHAAHPESLERRGSLALMHAKRNGRGRIQMFEESFESEIARRAALGQALRGACARGEFALAWQPKIDLASGAVTGAEGLARWTRPGEGLVSPGEFIPVAEHTGLITDITDFALRAAGTQAQAWEAAGLTPMRCAINVSAADFIALDLVARVDAALAETGVDPELLEIEITESTLVEDIELVCSVLTLLRRRGLTVAVDDFGTGYASLAYLRNLPVDRLKIDRAFVARLDRNGGADLAIIRAILALADNLGLATIAEGVETAEQARILREEGCQAVQGFFYAKPLPAADLAAYAHSRRLELGVA